MVLNVLSVKTGHYPNISVLSSFVLNMLCFNSTSQVVCLVVSHTCIFRSFTAYHEIRSAPVLEIFFKFEEKEKVSGTRVALNSNISA